MSIREQIKEKQTEYYNLNSKSILFKSSQKNSCAEEINKQFDISNLIKATIYQIPETNIVYFDYPLFKTYATPTIYEIIIQSILELFAEIINIYGSYQVHANLDTFSMSSAHRYGDIIRDFCHKCLRSETRYANYMEKFCIYNTPAVMQSISKLFNPLINENVKKRIELIDKKESEDRLKQLFA
jgi:hypothetical protein